MTTDSMKMIREAFKCEDYHTMKRAIKRYGKSTITIEPYEETLSEPQRKYYFGVVVKTCSNDEKYRGKSQEEIHTELKVQYLPDYEAVLSEFAGMVDISTVPELLSRFLLLYHDLTITTSTVGNFERYLSDIRRGESKKGIYIPVPNEEQWWDGAENVK